MEKDLAEERMVASQAANGSEWEEVENPEGQEFSDLAKGPEVRVDPWADEIDRDEVPVMEGTLQPEPLRYPEPREDLPDLPGEQEVLVDAWWKDFKPLFKKPYDSACRGLYGPRAAPHARIS